DRLRRALAASARDADRSGRPYVWHSARAAAARLPDRPLRLLRRVSACRSGGPERAAPARRSCVNAAREHSGRVQRAWRADHVATLFHRPGACEARAAGEVVHGAGETARLDPGVSFDAAANGTPRV